MNNPKITMLGPSGSGKTCYLLTMYNVVGAGIGGISISTPNLDDGHELNALFERLISEEGEDRWPKGTDEKTTKKYTFSLNYALERIFAFDWLDYRGGAITESSENFESKQLLETLADSFGIIICVPGDLLAKYGDKAKILLAKKLNINNINNIITSITDSPQETKTRPKISIVITKADFIPQSEWPDEKIAEKIKDLFSVLFTPGGGWDVCIIPVTLGNTLSEDRDEGDIDPVGVHFPILDFAKRYNEDMLKFLNSAELESRNRRQTNIVELMDINMERGFFAQIFGDGASRRNEIQKRENEIRETEKVIAEAEKNSLKMTRDLAILKDTLNGKYQRFINGERVNS